METIELSKSFIRYWQTSDWESFGNLLDENVELELPWLKIKIKKKESFLKFFTMKDAIETCMNINITKIIGNDNFGIITGSSLSNKGMFGTPNADLIKGHKTNKFEFCFVLEWKVNKLSKIYVNDTFVRTPEIVMNDWIDQI